MCVPGLQVAGRMTSKQTVQPLQLHHQIIALGQQWDAPEAFVVL